ncbi:MAG TPA: hypothetical protein DD658_10040 [Deltaproteobacteria bacterium]|nr:MAG: hypothetical protein A2X88_07560 [Deltaproteobacteria bacterium GWC2_65_14]HBO70425.1 hypothetical protein [Deltaproteobacteria bacterium]
MGLRDSFKKLFTPSSKDDRGSLSRKVQESPQDPQARQKLGLFLLRQGEIVEGIDQLARTAVLYEKSGFTGKAIAVLRHILKHDFSNLDLQKWLIRLQAQQGHLRDAQDQLQEIASGGVRFANDDQKIEFYRQVAGSMPGSPLPTFLAADVLLGQRKFHEAVNELEKAAVHVVPAGMVPEFATRMNTLLSRAGDNPGMLESCGFLWLAAARSHEALPILKRVAVSGRSTDDSQERADQVETVLRALEEGRESHLAGAMSFTDAAKRLAEPQPAPPSPVPAPSVKEESGAADVDPEEERMVKDAVSRLQAKVQEEIGESDPEARYNLGIAYKEMGLLAEAVEEFATARRHPPLFLGASCLLSETLASMGDLESAVAALDDVLSTDDLDESAALDVRYQKALLVARAGREEEAREILLSIYETAPDYRDVRQRTESFRQ